MIQKLRATFGSKTKAQEIILLLHDAKTVVRQAFTEEEMDKVIRFCMINKIHFVKSHFKVIFTDDESYSNGGIRIPETDERPGYYFIYFSKDEQQAWLAAYYEMINNHKDFGLLLGYPSCCVDFFCQNFNQQNTNPQHLPTNPWTNLTHRNDDAVLLSHFPCSSDCHASIQLAQQNFNILREHDPERAQQLITHLHHG